MQTGGVWWHWRAWRRQLEWSPFRHWLSLQWRSGPAFDSSPNNPPHGTLIILGPSAGWTLPTQFAQIFNAVICVDMDPVAPLLFNRQHPHPNVQWLRQDFIATLPRILARWPDATLLFANSLGQQGLLHDNPAHTLSLLENVTQQLKGRRWFSYHDRLSLHFEKPAPAKLQAELLRRTHALTSGQALSSGDLLKRLELDTLLAETHSHPARANVLVTDHLTDHLLPANCQRRYSLLPVTDRALHVVEAAWADGFAQ